MKTEILAPAGNFEALTSAVRAGADAVYFGTGSFNARRNASNFVGDELKAAAELCHSHGVRFHITLNTLVSDEELPQFKETVKRVCEVNADALILQDLGALKIVREMCPDIELHASTQLSTGTLEGIKKLADLGFTRAVLPRELSKKEIQYLCENSPIELEMFVHGALCMSVSGQCLLSAILGSRSGNRGLCAQPCRLPFHIAGGTGTDLSLKDLSLVEEIKELADLGIASFKIEGRMKRPEYVSAAVTACRESLNGQFSVQRADELEALFSRSGFTKGYYENVLGKSMFGKREKENVTSATTSLLKKYASIYEKEKPCYAVDFYFTAHLGEPISLVASANGKKAYAESTVYPEEAIHVPLSTEKVKTQLSKCGATVFKFHSTEFEMDENISVPISVINELRRTALEKLETAITERQPYSVKDFNIKRNLHTPLEQPKKYLCFRNANNIPEQINADKIFVPLDTNSETIKALHAGVIVPRGIFFNAEEITQKIKQSGASYALCNTLDGVAAAQKAGTKVIGGPSLNIFNSIALEEIEHLGVNECALSFELTTTQIEKLGTDVKRGVAVYGRTPLMLTRNCPVKNGKTCAECKRQSTLIDRKGIEFPVLCTNGFSEIFNSRPTYMADRMRELKNIDFMLFDFTTESKAEILRILSAYETGEKPQGEFTRGLFYRGVE